MSTLPCREYFSPCYHSVMAINKIHLSIANSFGALGYISMIVQWLWVLVILGYPLLLHNDFSFLLPRPSAASPPAPIDYGWFTPYATIIVIAVTVLTLCATLYVLVRMPYTVGRRSSGVVRKTAEVLIPVITHRPLTKKQRYRLTYRVTWWVKILLVLSPLLLLVFASSETGIDQRAVGMVGMFCAACSALYFCLQRLLQYIWKLDPRLLW